MATRKTNNYKGWTKEDDELLVAYAGDMTYAELAKQLGRTPAAIASRLKLLRARSGDVPPAKRGRPRKAEADTGEALVLTPVSNGVYGHSPEPDPNSKRIGSIMTFVETAVCNGYRIEIPGMGVTINA